MKGNHLVYVRGKDKEETIKEKILKKVKITYRNAKHLTEFCRKLRIYLV